MSLDESATTAAARPAKIGTQGAHSGQARRRREAADEGQGEDDGDREAISAAAARWRTRAGSFWRPRPPRPRPCASARPGAMRSRSCRPTSARAPASFKKHGIDVEISSFGGDARVQQAMAADGIDIGLGSGPGLAFIVKGSPVKGIAAMADPPLTVRAGGAQRRLDQDARRSQGQEGRRLDRRLGDRLDRRRDCRGRRAGATTASR